MVQKLKKKIIIIYGTRPELIKLAPVIIAIRKNTVSLDLMVCSTGQHHEMLKSIESFFEIKPDLQLSFENKDAPMGKKFSELLAKITDVIQDYSPDKIIVHGDTLSAVVGAIAAFMSKTSIAHIEAGLRTQNRKVPYPEEFNRRTISNVADEHFAPTQTAQNNLINEGISESSIFLTGNTVIDALKYATDKLSLDKVLNKSVAFSLSKTCEFDLVIKDYVLMTGHRRENFGSGFEKICDAIQKLAHKFPNVMFVYPVHLNPNVQKPVQRTLANLPNVKLIPPQDYVHFIFLMMHSKLILTDSGGIQEEAPSLGKPVLLMRDETERPEILEAGMMEIVGTNSQNIIDSVSRLLTDNKKIKEMSKVSDIYGDGTAAQLILKIIIEGRI